MKRKKSLYEKYGKRILDFCSALLALIVLSPIMLFIALLVRIKLGSPVIFKQKRPGKNGKIFEIYKYRSMLDGRDKTGNLLPDEIRLTSFGKKLRATSLDELPELFNILKGELSIIGPRPLLVSYLPYYTEEEHHRHDVTPGLTGLSQVSGRNYLTWEEKFSMDLKYVNNISFIMDLSILIKTFAVVFKRENVETASFIEHDGVIYRPLNVERAGRKKKGE